MRAYKLTIFKKNLTNCQLMILLLITEVFFDYCTGVKNKINLHENLYKIQKRRPNWIFSFV